jgi:hypothetical protein
LWYGLYVEESSKAHKQHRCSRRARLWNRQASIILDLVLSVCVFAACSGKASAQSHGTSSTAFADYATKLGEDRHIKFWANYHQLDHPRKTVRKVNRYVRRGLQSHPHWRSHGPHYLTGPSLIGRNAALSEGPGGYSWRRRIVTTIFWIGERPRGNNPVPNARSSWDRYWYQRWV